MKIYPLLLVSIFAILSSAQADLTILSEMKGADLQPSDAGNVIMKMTGDKMRVDAGPAHIIILSAEKKMLIIVDKQKMVMVKSLNDAGGTASSEGETPVIERTGKTETINGFDCEQVLIKDKKGEVTELWMSSAAPDMSEFAANFKALSRANPKKSSFAWTTIMGEKDMRTYPIRSIHYDKDGKEQTRVTVLSISKTPLPASDFISPAGYAETVMPDFGGVGGTDISGSAPSSGAPSAMQQMQEIQKKIKSGQAPSPEDIQKMQDLARQMQPK